MSIYCRKAGILTTVQDLGRPGFRKLGINPGGAMDRTAVRLVNILLGNDDRSAVLEMHYPAGEYEFEEACVFAIGGGDFRAVLDDSLVQRFRLTVGQRGSVLRFTEKVQGDQIYLAVAGGVGADEWLSSRSTNLTVAIGGHGGRRVQKGDRIAFRSPLRSLRKGQPIVSRSLIPIYSRFPTVRITKGAEFDLLADEAKDALLEGSFTLSGNSNRMGYRLQGETLSLKKPREMISSAVNFGTIQLLPGGQMVILMADHQTTGGYPRVGHVIAQDLPLVSQLGPGDRVAFEMITLEEAEEITLNFERELRLLRHAVSFTYL